MSMPASKIMMPANSAADAAQAAAMAAQAQRVQNRQFMALTRNAETLCQQANGGANYQPFATGQPLTFNVPTANNAFLTGFWVRCALTVNCAAGASAVYALNAAAPLNLFDSIVVNYGGTQHNFRPYQLKYISQMRAATGQGQPRALVAGQTSAYLQAYYSSAPFTVLSGNNTWNLAFFVPLNFIHPQDVRGILPIQNGETTCQIIANCVGAPFGVDPVFNVVSAVSGTGHVVTVTGNISVIAAYKDGMSYSQLTALQPNLAGIETVQFLRDTPLNNLGSGQIFRNKVSFLHRIPWLIITVIDGNSSTKFSSTSNIQLLETTADQTGNRPFMRYGLNTNMDVREFYNDLSGAMGGLLQQDLDEGVLPLIYGPIFQQSDIGILEGQHYLNMTTDSGWTDFHYGVQLATVGGVAGIAPRIECHAVILNDPLVM
jgi:hypothetical protein